MADSVISILETVRQEGSRSVKRKLEYDNYRRRQDLEAETLDELNKNLKEVIEMLLEDGEPEFEGEFIGTQNVMVA